MKKLKNLWKSLDVDITVSKRELVLGVVAASLAGIVFGAFFSPKKNVMIGNNNGNNNKGSIGEENSEQEQEQEQEQAQEQEEA